MIEFLNDFDFPLDEDLIAKFPSDKRDESRLLVLSRTQDSIVERPNFFEIEEYLNPGDILVFNETKVSKRRVYLTAQNQRVHEAVFLESSGDLKKEWLCILKNRKKLKFGDRLSPLGFPNISFSFQGSRDDLSILLTTESISESGFELWGNIPIPPYLKRKANETDEERYQTIFAKNSGSVASPTAGLHFTQELKSRLESKGILFLPLTLEIGYGTFQPLTQAQLLAKKLHEEKYIISDETASALNLARLEKRRIISIGTTTLRALESSFDTESQKFVAKSGTTDIFLSPGDKIHSVQGLVTNFHLPRSSLLLLVSTFARKELVKRAYLHALQNKFRFYSYGDAMFLY